MPLLRLTLAAIVSIAALLLHAAPGRAESPLQLITLAYPPYITEQEGRPAGPVVDIVREAFRRSGQAVKIDFYPWSRGLSMVSSGQADALFTIKKTPEREQNLLFPAEALLSQDYVFFVRKDSPLRFNGDYASIAAARLGIVRNTSYGARFDAALQQGVFQRLEAANDYLHIFRMLLAGRVDAVICSRLVGLSYLRELKATTQIDVSGPPSETAHSYLVFTRAKNHAALAARFDQALAGMKKDGTLNRLLAPIR